jgi:transposase-like protein
MHAHRFNQWLARVAALNFPARLQALGALNPGARLAEVNAIIGELNAADRRCPACASERYYRHGQAGGLQRYRCRACGRTFNDLSGTPLARLRLREKWSDYLGTELESQSIRAAASQVGVHRNTVFRWRHRFDPPPGRKLPTQAGTADTGIRSARSTRA